MSNVEVFEAEDVRKCKGVFDLHVYRNGVEIEHYVDHNLIVNTARIAMAHLTGDADTNKKVAYIAVGTNSTDPDMGDTELSDGSFQKALDSHDYPTDDDGNENYSVRFHFSLTEEEANGIAIAEYGLLCADKTLFARKSRKVIAKEADISLTGTWTILF